MKGDFLKKITKLAWRHRLVLALVLVVGVFAAQLLFLKNPQVQGAYTIANSARFATTSSAYLSRTTGTPTDQNKFTWSGWVRRSSLTNAQGVFGYYLNGSTYNELYINSGGGLTFEAWDPSVVQRIKARTNAIYRDPAAWMHVVVVADRAQAVDSDRVKMWVNGVAVTSWAETPSWDNSYAAMANAAATGITIGSLGTLYLGAYLSDVYFIDGQALTPASFGETDANGYWRPKAYTGTYGTNGFKLNFSNGASLGTDTSGVNNNWTVNALTASDQMIDTPTNSFATGNPLALGGSQVYTSGNLVSSGAATSTIFMSTGKWYWEVTAKATGVSAGVMSGTGSSVTASVTNNTTIGFQFDADAGTLASTTGSGFVGTVSGLTGGQFAYATGGSSLSIFGQGGTTTLTYDSASGGYFRYTPPSGYKALSTNNLPEPTIAVPKNYFDAVTYTGTGAAMSVGSGAAIKVFLTSGTSWTVPSDWNSASNTIEVIGGGAGGAGSIPASYGSGAGGGGGYSKAVNVALTPSGSVAYAVGAGGGGGAASTIGGNGGDSYLCNSTSNCANISGTAVVVGAKGGSTGTVSSATVASGGAGGALASGIGTTKYSGGAGGGAASGNGGGAGGGAGGPLGTGGAGGTSNSNGSGSGGGGGGGGSAGATGGAGGNNAAGTGGGTAGTSGVAGGAGSNGGGGGSGNWNGSINTNGGVGGAGVEWDATHGSGGGGGSGAGGGGVTGTVGQAGGLYGAGGAGGSGVSSAGGAGAQGIVVITYTPTTLAFQPSLVWLKSRSNATDHGLFDSVRGVAKLLKSNSSAAEVSSSTSLTAFNANGFSLGTDGTFNTSALSYISWLWKESPTAGFDIVTYTGTGVAVGIPHSLGVAPKFMIVKSQSATGDPAVYHASASTTPQFGYLLLDSTAALAADYSGTVWNGNAPQVAQFIVGTDSKVNAAGVTYVAYLFAEVPNFSKFGSYTGNGSADGPFVYTGFKPRYLLIKRTNTTGSWQLHDTARSAYNPMSHEVYPNLTAGEDTTWLIDSLVNGFKLRSDSSSSDNNASGSTYVYAAFAEQPLKYSAASAAPSDLSGFVQAVAFFMGMPY